MSDASATFAQSGQYSASRFPRAYQLLVICRWIGAESSHLHRLGPAAKSCVGF